MLRTGILNPQLLSLLARVRHTNTLVIADRGFPFWPQLETIDLALVDDIPTVLDVLRAIRANFVVGQAWMAEEFLRTSDDGTRCSPGATSSPRIRASSRPTACSPTEWW